MLLLSFVISFTCNLRTVVLSYLAVHLIVMNEVLTMADSLVARTEVAKHHVIDTRKNISILVIEMNI